VALDRQRFAAYAKEQITAADQIMAGNRPAGGGVCSCGRTRPCPVAESCAGRREDCVAVLAIAEQTQALLIVAAR